VLAYGKAPGPVRDTEGTVLDLEERPLGRGGQGVVYRVRGTGYAVKLVEEQGRSKPGDELDQRLRRLRWLPLDGIPITMPRRSLAPPHVGYLMDLLEGMESMEPLCLPPDEVDDWYAETGGLRRRLRLLSACSDALARLHARGLVYGDLSPANVFIAADPKQDGLRLIDADNIAVETSARGRIVGTLRYAAPEICTGRSGNTPFSDAYSFAVLAYEVLVADHPFGELIDDEDDLAAVHGGQEPWALHSSDDRNRSPFGLTLDKVNALMSDSLREHFQQNFEAGLLNQYARPEALRWTEALDRAADMTVACTGLGCEHTYLVRSRRCPFCGAARPEVLPVVLWDWVPAPIAAADGKPVHSELRHTIAAQSGERTRLTERHTRVAPDDRAAPRLLVRWNGGDTVEITNTGTDPVRLTTGGPERRLVPGASTSTHTGALIHFGPGAEIHRAAGFQPGAWD
jgi:eukaryotic-like serine/threonine-protein kinase